MKKPVFAGIVTFTTIHVVRRVLLIGLIAFLLIKFIACAPRIENVSSAHFIVELNHREKNATIVSLTEVGKEQEVLVVPPVIFNYPVEYIGRVTNFMMLGEGIHALTLTTQQKKLYLPYSLKNRIGLISVAPIETILNIANPSDVLIASIERFYEEKLYYLNQDSKLNSFFMFNFSAAENSGYYWMDYISGSNSYVIPVNPVRDGYTFGGWYYEPESITPWDNLVPTDESELLTLYAKWI